MKRAVVVWLAVTTLIVAGCDSMMQKEERATLVGTWEASRAGELLYIARLKDDGTYTFTSPGESEPHQRGNWSYDRATQKLTLGPLTFSGIAEEADTQCLGRIRIGDRSGCLVTWTRVA